MWISVSLSSTMVTVLDALAMPPVFPHSLIFPRLAPACWVRASACAAQVLISALSSEPALSSPVELPARLSMLVCTVLACKGRISWPLPRHGWASLCRVVQHLARGTPVFGTKCLPSEAQRIDTGIHPCPGLPRHACHLLPEGRVVYDPGRPSVPLASLRDDGVVCHHFCNTIWLVLGHCRGVQSKALQLCCQVRN